MCLPLWSNSLVQFVLTIRFLAQSLPQPSSYRRWPMGMVSQLECAARRWPMIWAILMGELTFMLGGETSMGTVYTWAVAHQQCITGPSNLHATKTFVRARSPPYWYSRRNVVDNLRSASSRSTLVTAPCRLCTPGLSTYWGPTRFIFFFSYSLLAVSFSSIGWKGKVP